MGVLRSAELSVLEHLVAAHTNLMSFIQDVRSVIEVAVDAECLHLSSFSMESNCTGTEYYVFRRNETIKALFVVSSPNSLHMLPPLTWVAEQVHVLLSDSVYRLLQSLERVSLDLRTGCDYSIPVEAPLFCDSLAGNVPGTCRTSSWVIGTGTCTSNSNTCWCWRCVCCMNFGTCRTSSWVIGTGTCTSCFSALDE